MTTIVVAGGGITGLVAARDLATRSPPGTKILLVEASDRLGGKVRTHRWNGAAIEAGPDWFLTTGDAMTSLCREFGLGNSLVQPTVSGALLWRRNELQPMPRGFVRGFPTTVAGLLTCSNLSARGRLRGLGDLVLPGPLRGPDISVGSLVRRRFGRELLERLVDPILAASRSGAADRMSLAAAAAEIDSAARSHRSVMIGLRRRAEGPGPAFRGLAGGMETITEALAGDLRAHDVNVRLGTRVVAVEAEGTGYTVRFENQTVAAEKIVIALPSPEAAAVLRPLDAALAADLETIRYTAAAVVALVYPPGSATPPDGASGFLVPSDEGRLITAAAWYSAKWAGAGPDDGSFVMRCFAGRAPDDPVLRLTDDELIWRIAHELALATGIRAPLVTAFVSRWTHALPLYEVGHLERVKGIERGVARHPGLALAGAGYRGSGLPDCVESGRAAATKILSH